MIKEAPSQRCRDGRLLSDSRMCMVYSRIIRPTEWINTVGKFSALKKTLIKQKYFGNSNLFSYLIFL